MFNRQIGRTLGAADSELEFRVYTFKELAGLYFPGNRPAHASRRLAQLIRQDALLYEELQARGFIKGRRSLTPAQVEVLLRHLGSPTSFHNL